MGPAANDVDVTLRPPTPAASAAPADWLTSRITWRGPWATGAVGTGFGAYARVFHPLGDGPGASRWADIAARNGRTMHAGAQWEKISTSVAAGGSDDGSAEAPDEPTPGDLEAAALATLCTVLAGHTSTPDHCYFGVWDGWGWQHAGAHAVVASGFGGPAPEIRPAPDEWQLDLSAPRFSLPARDYLLYAGPIEEATRIGHWVTATWFDPQSPSIFWPADHAWCVSTEVDFDSTFVGGSDDSVADICGTSALEAWPIPPDAPHRDTINI